MVVSTKIGIYLDCSFMSLMEKLSLPKRKIMSVQEFIPKGYQKEISEGKVTWRSPSNIALVKYWGKRDQQIPANPSVSFTLDACSTTTTLSFRKKLKVSGDMEFELFFEQEKKDDFKPKVRQFFERVREYLPFLTDMTFRIDTSNTFPHSSGIASSASGMSALALCLMSIEKELDPEMNERFFMRKASFLARLGSGSAGRSIEGPVVAWGNHSETTGSSDLFAIRYPYRVHNVFRNYQDTILLVDQGEKQVSSSLGHDLMKNHPFARQRFAQAGENMSKFRDIFESGDLMEFVKLVESEALTLHAMMMTGDPYFLLMKPNTLAIINEIFRFREKTSLHLCFTLDAGANVHLLYPETEKEAIMDFIKSSLTTYCDNGHYICDQVGSGAEQVEQSFQ